MIHVFTETPEWATILIKYGPVPGPNSLGAELGGCAMSMNNFGSVDRQLYA